MQALELRKNVQGTEHPLTLLSMTILAWIWNEQGQREQALSLLSEALQLCKTVIGIDHPHTKMHQQCYDRWLDEGKHNNEDKPVSQEGKRTEDS